VPLYSHSTQIIEQQEKEKLRRKTNSKIGLVLRQISSAKAEEADKICISPWRQKLIGTLSHIRRRKSMFAYFFLSSAAVSKKQKALSKLFAPWVGAMNYHKSESDSVKRTACGDFAG
jgi:hypothetical protein